MRWIYSGFVFFWLIAFTVLTARAGYWGIRLFQTESQFETTSQDLDRGRASLEQLIQGLKKESKELEFLQGLMNILPQEKGYLRTENAVERDVVSLRQKVGRRLHDELHIVVDTQANKLYLKKGLTLLWKADCSVGKGGLLIDKATGRRWEFATPRGVLEVQSKTENPIWTKPDWAFVETHEPIPPPEDSKRRVPGELGAYLLNLGDGYLIHGTKAEADLGHSVSHGCVRLSVDNLKKLYDSVPVGTKVYIY